MLKINHIQWASMKQMLQQISLRLKSDSNPDTIEPTKIIDLQFCYFCKGKKTIGIKTGTYETIDLFSTIIKPWSQINSSNENFHSLTFSFTIHPDTVTGTRGVLPHQQHPWLVGQSRTHHLPTERWTNGHHHRGIGQLIRWRRVSHHAL